MKLKSIFFHPRAIWVYLGASAVAFRALASPELIEEAYSRGVFQGIRLLFSLVAGWLPFALVYVLFGAVVFWAVKSLIRFFQNKEPWQNKLVGSLTSLLAFAGGVTFLFLFLWGFNYGRVPLENQINIEPKPLTVNELKKELDYVTAEVIRLREQLPGAGDSALSIDFLPKNTEREMRDLLVAELEEAGYPTSSKVRGRLLFPKGLLLRISTAGVYIPFTGEGHIDPGLHHLQLPFVMAHEMSHGYGFGDEGTCNFLAYLSCLRSENDYLKYIGQLYFFRYVASDYRSYRPEEYKVFYQNLPEGVKNDLRAIRREMEKYPDIFPKFRDATYNAYLKAQGISEGLKNYNRVTMLAAAWRKKKDE